MESAAPLNRVQSSSTTVAPLGREVRAVPARSRESGHYSVQASDLDTDPRSSGTAVAIPSDAVCVFYDTRHGAPTILPAAGGRPAILRQLQLAGYAAFFERAVLSPDSDSFKRRLVRALNEEGFDGFYLLDRPPGYDSNPRCSRARLVESQVQVKNAYTDEWLNVPPTAQFLSARTNQKVVVDLDPPRPVSPRPVSPRKATRSSIRP